MRNQIKITLSHLKSFSSIIFDTSCFLWRLELIRVVYFFFFPPQRLAEWVAVQSVSAWPEKRGEIKKMMEIAAKDIERLGGTVELVDVGKQKVGVCESVLLQCFF